MPHDRYGPHTLKLHRVCGFGEVSDGGLSRQVLENPMAEGTGTFIAISNLVLGVVSNIGIEPAVSERAPRERRSERTAGEQEVSRRGGARNRADRESNALTSEQVGNLFAASEHANLIGLQFNRMVTVHWQAAGVPLEAMAAATGRFTDLLTKAMARHGCRTAWAWVHEGGEGKGGHCHLLCHVPPALTGLLARRQRGWLKTITGRPYRARVLLSRSIGGRKGLEIGNPGLHAINLSAALAYLAKGAAPEAAEQYHLTRLESGGRVIGKRAGTSQNIGRKARKQHDG